MAEAQFVEVSVVLPSGVSYMVASVSASEPVSSMQQLLQEFSATCKYTNYKFALPGSSVTINESMEIGNYVISSTDEEQNECKEPPKDDHTDLAAQKLTLVLVPLLYDMKKCRAQLSRVRENIASPPTRQFTSSSGGSSSSSNNDTGCAEGKGPETSKLTITEFSLPQEDEIFSHPSLDKFYRETLLRVGSPSNNGMVKLPADCIKSVSISGWNPPPPYRCAAGDLLYFEIITADEGSFHVTGTTNGFFVNRSTRNHFDPTPTTNAHFSHELLDTILGLSANCRAAWKALCSQVHEDVMGKSGALDGIANLYCNGRDTDPSLKLQWNVSITDNFSTDPSASASTATGAGAAVSGTGLCKDRFVHGYDMSRAHDALTDLFGADDVGVLREWNDEIQTTRALATKDISDKVLQARYISKIYTEFNEAVKAGVIAITEGYIVPINPMDDENNRVYMYNNIFYSRAVDSKDNFRICGGVEASRKMAGHDLRNQRLIQAAGIDGLCTVLHCVVDYKGDRLIAQTVIPGVLQGGQHPARLMFGALEMGKRMSVKSETLKLMQALFSRFYIPTRTITAQLQFQPAESSDASNSETLSKGTAVSAQSLTADAVEEDLSNIGVKTDELDEVVPMTNTTLPHIGCLETKVLRGSDGRLYTLEAMRLTPRDANYVKGDKGTKHISSELLSHVDDGVATTYVLRLELVENYVHTKVKSLQLELAQELVRQRQLNEKEKEEKQKLLGTAAAGNDGTEANEVKKSEAEEEQDRREKAQLQKEMTARVEAITPASLHLELNPNVFIEGFDCDVDPTIVQKDEDTARLLSDFLFKVVGDIVEQARVSTFCPGDNAALVEGLHGSGVNMRYLGHIADLSYAQELEDAALLKTNHQRLQSMPSYWLELVEVEILARCFKHVLAARFRAHPEVKLCPAPTIATLLNHIFASSPPTSEDRKERSESVISVGTADGNTMTSDVGGPNGGTSPTRKKKKKKGSDHQDEFSMTQSTTVPDMPNVAGTPEDMYKEIQSLALRKFALKEFALIRFDRTATKKKNSIPLGHGQVEDEQDHNDVSGSTENKEGSSSIVNGHLDGSGTSACIVLDDRISRCMLLRRICEVCGVRVASRDYHFPPSGGRNAGPLVFEAKDIWGCIPLMKSCEQSVPLTECRSLLANAKTYMERGQISLAFDMLSETSQYQQQITGPVHKEYLMITSVMTKLLVDAGDAQAALAQCAKSLSLAVQLFGLDSPDAGLFHQQMASILAEMLDRPGVALQHLLAARYIAELTGGPNHPDVGAMYLRIAGVLGQINRISNDDEIISTEKTKEDDVKEINGIKEESNNNNNNKAVIEVETSRRREIILRCLAVAKSKTYDVEQSAVITKNVAELLAQMGHYNSALAEQRTVLKTFDQLYDSPDDERRKDAKARVEKYLRLNTIEKVAAAKEMQRMQSQLVAEKSPMISTTYGSANVIRTNDNNTNINGNSNGHAEKDGISPGKKKKSK